MTLFSWIAAAFGLVGAFAWGGLPALVIATLLTIMEISLSFDNAVVNATVLRRMDPKWQQRFLTWGILIAVFGMRLVFPVVIVAVAAGLVQAGERGCPPDETTTGGARLVYVGRTNAGGAVVREQDALTPDAQREWRTAVHQAAAATAGPLFVARVNDGCGHCPVRSSCPVQEGRR